MILLLSQNLPGGPSLGKGKYESQMIAAIDLRITFEPHLEDVLVCFSNSLTQLGHI